MPIKDTVTVGAKEFAAAVSWAAKWVTAKPVVPVHGGLMLEIGGADGGLHISAYGENASARASVAYEAGPDLGSPQRAVVSGRLLAELVGTFGDKPVEISGTDESVELKVGRWHGTLPTLTEDDYPTLPGALPTIGHIGGDLLADAVGRVGAAVGKDVTKGPFFAGAYVGFGAEALTIMATDRYRAARAVQPWAVDAAFGPDTPEAAIALGTALVDAATSFAGPDTVAIGCDGHLLSLTSPARSITMRLLEGEYPANTLSAWFELPGIEALAFAVADMTDPLRRAAMMREKDGPIRVSLTRGLMLVRGEDRDSKRGGDDEVDADYEGRDIVYGFNPDYFGAMLGSAPGGRVTVRLTDNRKPWVVTVDGNDAWTHVLVPIRLPS